MTGAAGERHPGTSHASTGGRGALGHARERSPDVLTPPSRAPRLPGLGTWTPGARPTRRTSLPFVLMMSLGVVGVALPPYDGGVVRPVVAVVVAGVLYAVHRLALSRDHRTWLDPLAPLGCFPLVMLLRDATGGADSGLTPLAAIPLMWLAMFGTRRDVWVGAVALALTFLLPQLLFGAPDYPLPEWRRALVWSGFGVLIPPTVQRVVTKLAAEHQRNRENTARLEGVARGATLSGMITTNLEGRITSFGVGAESQLGYAADDVLGADLVELMLDHAELEVAARELGVRPGFPVLSRLAHLRAASRVWSMIRRDGERIYVRMAVTELRDEDGRLVGYLTVSIDSTDAIVSQAGLTEAEERWRALMDHLPDTTVIMVERRTGVTLVTGAGFLVGTLRDGAGRRLTELVDREEPGRLAGMLEEAFAGRESRKVLVDVAGEEHEFRASPLPSKEPRRQALVVARDVSRDRRRERDLTAAKEHAERLFDAAPQGIALLDTDGRVTRANPALTVLLGAEDVVGRSLASFSSDPDDTAVADHLGQVRSTEDHRAETGWTLRGADGEEVHVVLISTMMRAEQGEADRILTNVVDVSERHRYEQRLAFLAEHDALTGLANRRRFDKELNQHVDDCVRYGARGALLMLDLDHFKLVNDTMGHAVGDELLVDVAELLSDRLRSTDLVARIGGDEFAILLPHANRRAAENVASSIVERVAKNVSVHGDARAGVSVSVGCVIVRSSHRSADDLLSAADSAMYVAKKSGRNRYTFLAVDSAS